MYDGYTYSLFTEGETGAQGGPGNLFKVTQENQVCGLFTVP